MHAPVTPDATVYAIALLLSLISGLLFGSVPLTQVLRANPYEVVKSGTSAKTGRRITAREILLAAQIAICAVLVTSSMVAVRGLVHAQQSHFGFDPQNSILVGADLHMAGYTGDRLPAMQKRLLDTIGAIPGVEVVGVTDALLLNDTHTENVFSDQAADQRPSNAATTAFMYQVSPDYLRAEGTTLVAGRNLTWHDDANSPKIAIVNPEFARKLFGSVENAIGGHYRISDGTRVQVVGVTEEGKYGSLTEEPQAAMFLPILQLPSNSQWIVARTNRDPKQIAAAVRATLHQLDPGLPVNMENRYDEMATALFPSEIATVALGIMGGMGATLAVTGIFGMAAYSVSKRLRELGIRVALGAQRKEVLRAALGRAFRLLAFGSGAGLVLGLLASRILALMVYEATPRDPVVLAGVVASMCLLGLVATWIPARRALSVDPMILLRDQ